MSLLIVLVLLICAGVGAIDLLSRQANSTLVSVYAKANSVIERF